jgi:nitroimidazol reductase NimA-like FMN-containing flavoprotein (pyridoxamine 5'-phosphate oxidase superfamily)
VLVRTSARSDLVRAVDGVVVAFEADEFDTETRSGWSVVVTGRAHVVTDPGEHERLLRTGPDSWMPIQDDVFIRIEAAMVTGRELTDLRVTG